VALDPRHPLCPGADGTTDEGAEGRDHAGERAAAGSEDDPDPEPDDPESERLRRGRLALPGLGQVGQEAGSRTGGLVERLVAARPPGTPPPRAAEAPPPRRRGPPPRRHRPAPPRYG